MKRLMIWTIISSWLVHVFVPILYKLYYGVYPHHPQGLGYVPDEFETKTAIIISAVYLMSIIFIFMFKIKDKPIIPRKDSPVFYYYIVVFIAAVMLIRISGGAYSSALTGGLNGSLYAYFLMFFSPQVLFLMYLYSVGGRKNIILFIGAYLIFTLLSFSRQGALFIALNAVGYIFCVKTNGINILKKTIRDTITKNKRIFIFVATAMVVIAPISFVVSSNNRNTISSDANHTVIETIAARCSCLETSGLALYKYDNDEYDRKVFLNKYGVVNQTARIIDSTVPGTIFNGDVDPNQYFRYIFGYMSYEAARKYYSSVNFMLPIYMIVKYGYVVGIIISILVIAAMSYWILRMKNLNFQVCMACVVLKGTLYYFDWVMIWKDVLIIALTIFSYNVLAEKFRFSLFKPKIRFNIRPHRFRITIGKMKYTLK